MFNLGGQLVPLFKFIVMGFLDSISNIFNPAGIFDFALRDWQRQDTQSSEHRFANQMLDRVNEYNTPQNQVSRLVQAGVTPGAAIGSVAGEGAVSAQSVSSGSGPNIPSGGLLDSVQKSLSVGSYRDLLHLQMDDLEASINLKKTQAGEMKRLNDHEINRIDKAAEDFEASAGLKREQATDLRTFRSQLYRMNEASIQKLYKDVDHISTQIDYLDGLISKIPLEKDVLFADWINKQEDTRLKESMQELYSAETQQKLAEVGLIKTAAVLNQINSYKSVAEMRKVLAESVSEDFKNLMLKHGINPSGLVGQIFLRLDSFINANSYRNTAQHPFDVLGTMLGEIKLVLDGFTGNSLPSEVGDPVGRGSYTW